MKKLCPVCDMPFKDGDKLAAVVVSFYKRIDSDVSFALSTPGPRDCLEIIHFGCYDPAPQDEAPQVGDIH